jgi:HEAT repeat protein
VPPTVPHDRVRDRGDRTWTSTLLDIVRDPATTDGDRDEAFTTLGWVEDYRAVDPLSRMVEDGSLPATIRERAGEVLCGFGHDTTSAQRRRWWNSGDGVLMSHALALMDRQDADIVAEVAGEDDNPLQSVAIRTLTWGFDELPFQAIKIAALGHADPAVRRTAADALFWDEPVDAEPALIQAASDPVEEVAVAAVNTLQYYRTRSVLRALADVASRRRGTTATKASECLWSLAGDFESALRSAPVDLHPQLIEWVQPVRDLLDLSPHEVTNEPGHASARSSQPVIPAAELLATLDDPEGEWQSKLQHLRALPADAYDPKDRRLLTNRLRTHPDPEVRAAGTRLLAAWSCTDALLHLIGDPQLSVRKPAMYYLGDTPQSDAVAKAAWLYLQAASGTTANESLRTFVRHAPADEARRRLLDIARSDLREGVQAGAIAHLATLGAAAELTALAPKLAEPPAVTWAVHIALLDAIRTIGVTEPANVEHLRTVDNLDLTVAVLRFTRRA